jgi:hypothetical protein
MALTERCRCRCGGTRHGRRAVASREALATLPEDDPHHIPASRRLEGHRGPSRPFVGVQMTVDPAIFPEKLVYGRLR